MTDLQIPHNQDSIELQLTKTDERVNIIAPSDGVGGYRWALRVDEGSPTIVDVTLEFSQELNQVNGELLIGGGENRIFSIIASQGCSLSLILARPYARAVEARTVSVVILASVAESAKNALYLSDETSRCSASGGVTV